MFDCTRVAKFRGLGPTGQATGKIFGVSLFRANLLEEGFGAPHTLEHLKMSVTHTMILSNGNVCEEERILYSYVRNSLRVPPECLPIFFFFRFNDNH